MVKTGTYKYVDGILVKVSDKIPSIKSPIYFPKTGGYYSESLNKHFESKTEKRNFMKKKGYAEVG